MSTKVKSKKAPVVLPPIPFNELLQHQSITYWKVAQAWNGCSQENITTEDAFSYLNGVLKELNPARPLAMRVNMLKGYLIEFGSKKRMLAGLAANSNSETKIIIL